MFENIELYKWQKEALKYLESGKSIAIHAGAGAGKSLPHFIYIKKLINKLKHNQKIFWLVPFKALANSVYNDLSKIFDKGIIGLMTGEIKRNIKNAKIIVAIYESFYNRKDKFNAKFVVMDEIHELKNRKLIYETFKFVKNNNIQFSCITATFKNLQDYIPSFAIYICVNSSKYTIKKQFKFLPNSKLYSDRYLYEKILNKYQTLIFRFSKRKIYQDTLKFVKLIEVKKEIIEKYKEVLNKVENELLKEAIKRGFGFHNSDLSFGDRKIVEDLYRKKVLKFLIVTDSISTGVNLPAECIVMRDIKKYDKGKLNYIEQNLLIQIYGRVGRKGYSRIALIYLPIDAPVYFTNPKVQNI